MYEDEPAEVEELEESDEMEGEELADIEQAHGYGEEEDSDIEVLPI